jgi:class 3 adenylate cyclase
MAKTIDEIIKKHYDEAVCGIVDKVPSALNRGEGTEREFYMLKIDLVDSTVFTWTRTHKTYLRLAHTFLSSVDEITRGFGADDDQVEYVGDSIIAYFRADKVNALSVLYAAYYCQEAALQMKTLDATFSKYHFLTKTILHYGKLILARIGPRGDTFVTAIGPALHKACKMESRVSPGQSRVSTEFREKLQGRERLLLKPNYKETKVPKAAELLPATRSLSNPATLLGMSLSDLARPTENLLTGAIAPRRGLIDFARKTPVEPPQFEVKQDLIDYSAKWDDVARYIALLRR